MTECLGGLCKYILFGINIIIFVCGLVVLGIGIWALTSKNANNPFVKSEDHKIAGGFLITVGAVVTLISFLGCLGAINEVKWMLFLYFIILLIMFIFLLVAGILLFIFRKKVAEEIKKTTLDSIPKYNRDKSITQAWDYTQSNFNCCGIEVDKNYGYDIWKKNPDFTGDVKVPKSCCKGERQKADCQTKPDTSAHQQGCYNKIKEFIQNHLTIIGGIAIGIALGLIFGMVLSCELYRRID